MQTLFELAELLIRLFLALARGAVTTIETAFATRRRTQVTAAALVILYLLFHPAFMSAVLNEILVLAIFAFGLSLIVRHTFGGSRNRNRGS